MSDPTSSRLERFLVIVLLVNLALAQPLYALVGKQAEFLIEQSFPWGLVSRIGVRSQQIYDQVRAALGTSVHQTGVEIKPNWYY